MIKSTNKSSSDKIMYLLKTGGPDTASSLAKKLKITSMGARQHLQHLTEEGFISFEDIKQGRGRPARYWNITTKANEKFPNTHPELSVQLIDAAEEIFGKEGVIRLIDARQKSSLARYQDYLKDSKGLGDKLERLAEIRTEEGYMSHIEETENGYLLKENHCPISTAAKNCQTFCDSELVLFKQVLGENYHIERNDHLLFKSESMFISYL